MRFKLLSCEIFYREAKFAISKSKHDIDVEYIPKGLHDMATEEMFQELQKLVHDSDDLEKYDYILMGYGLCNNGTSGLKSNNVPLVIPRTHDCIAILMGSKEQYKEHFDEHPGCYYLSTGWIERNEIDEKTSIQSQLKMNQSYDYFLHHYGEDNAQFLYDQLSGSTANYTELTYIKTGVEADDSFELKAEKEADESNWNYSVYEGNTSLLERFLNGIWSDEEFIIVNPGDLLVPSYDEKIFKISQPK